MNIKLPSIAHHVPGLKTVNEDQKQAVDSGSINRTFEKLLQDVNQQQFNAETKKIELMVTENKDIHGTMLALEKADLSMRLMLQIRNKLVSAYEEVMRMQV